MEVQGKKVAFKDGFLTGVLQAEGRGKEGDLERDDKRRETGKGLTQMKRGKPAT